MGYKHGTKGATDYFMGAISRLIALHRCCNGVVVALCKFAALLLLAGMTGVVLLQVFCRYVLNNALPWPEELGRFMMVWMTFLVAPYAYREGLNVNMDTLLAALPKRVARGMVMLGHLLIIGCVLFLFRESLWLVREADFGSSSLDWPMAWVFAVMPLSFVLLVSVGLEQIVRLLSGQDVQPGGAPVPLENE